VRIEIDDNRIGRQRRNSNCIKKERKDVFNEIYRKASWVIAPNLYIAEITNVLWKYNKAGILEHDESQQYIDDGIGIIDSYFSEKDLWKEVLRESINNEHSIYDMFYAVLARRNDATLVSNDKELLKICDNMKIQRCG